MMKLKHKQNDTFDDKLTLILRDSYIIGIIITIYTAIMMMIGKIPLKVLYIPARNIIWYQLVPLTIAGYTIIISVFLIALGCANLYLRCKNKKK